jgi:hypothetical protein
MGLEFESPEGVKLRRTVQIGVQQCFYAQQTLE